MPSLTTIILNVADSFANLAILSSRVGPDFLIDFLKTLFITDTLKRSSNFFCCILKPIL